MIYRNSLLFSMNVFVNSADTNLSKYSVNLMHNKTLYYERFYQFISIYYALINYGQISTA